MASFGLLRLMLAIAGNTCDSARSDTVNGTRGDVNATDGNSTGGAIANSCGDSLHVLCLAH